MWISQIDELVRVKIREFNVKCIETHVYMKMVDADFPSE